MDPKNAKLKLQERLKAEALLTAEKVESEGNVLRAKTGKKQRWLFDVRALCTQSDDLDLLAEVFWNEMEGQWPFQVGGLEVGAIPLVAGIVMKGRERGYKVNSFVVRKSRKKAGCCKQIEGHLTDDPIVVVDDLMNSGHSMHRVQTALEQEGKKISTVFVYVFFERKSARELVEQEFGARLKSAFVLSDFDLSLTGDAPVYFPEKNTLTPEWVFQPPSPNYVFSVPHSGPVLDDEKAYFGADNGFFYAVDKQTGNQVWEFQTGETIKGIFSCPVLTDNGVIFGAYDGSLYHLNRADGSVIWENPAAEYIGSSPCLAPDLGLVIIGLEHQIVGNQGSVAAFDIETGEKVWEHFVEQYLHSTPAYWEEERLVAIGSNDGKVLLLDAKLGTLYWEFWMEGPLKAAPTFDPKRRQVIAPSFDKNCYGIDIDTGREKWRFSAGHVFYNTALVVKDRVYVGSCDKYFYIYDLDKNELVKKMYTTGRILSHPQLINGDVWFGSNDGGVRQIDLDGNYLGGLLLPERPVTPIVYDASLDRYYVVTMGNFLVCMKPRG